MSARAHRPIPLTSTFKRNNRLAIAVAAILCSAGVAADQPQLLAVASPESSGVLDDVIVTGTRRLERTATDSSVPVDIVGTEDLNKTFTPDLNNKLQALVPSYSVKRIPLGDGAIFVRPAALRGLSPDQTLVLVNGKRRHRSAFVDVTSRGAEAVDISQFPQSAFKRIEVLRDGASAQYGSDAIAGVINFILDDVTHTDAYTQFGEHSKGDGESIQAAIATGFGFGDTGLLNLTFEYANSAPTSTAQQRPQAAILSAQGNTAIRQPAVQRYGKPDLENYRFFYNTSVEIGGAKAYAFGNYAYGWGENDFNWRAPDAATAADGTVYPRNNAYDTPVPAAPGYDLHNRYPGGFTPHFGSQQDDYSTVIGVRGSISDDWTWDLSGSYGKNKIHYRIRETINASLGPLSPTQFDAGARTQAEQTANLDFNYLWAVGLHAPINVAFGAEYRREEFQIEPGEEASYIYGPYKNLPPASNGFPGASPSQSGTWSHHNTAGYVDVDIDVTERWNVGLAGRFEDYSSFGSTTNGKLSTRFKIVEGFNVRGAISTGFRAPTPGQANVTNSSQAPDATTGVVRTTGLFPATSAGARLFGAVDLKPERSKNYSVGFVATPLSDLQVSLDAYRIDVQDRIGISQTFTLTAADRLALAAAGVPDAASLFGVRYFTNGFSTKTQGIDLVAGYQFVVGPGDLKTTLAYNYNETEVTEANPGVISAQTRRELEDSIPQQTGTLSLDYTIGKAGLFLRGRYYGTWLWIADSTNTATNQDVGAETLVDASFTYRFTDHVDVSVGLENAFDNYPDRARYATVSGLTYPRSTPFENDGQFFYGRVGVKF